MEKEIAPYLGMELGAAQRPWPRERGSLEATSIAYPVRSRDRINSLHTLCTERIISQTLLQCFDIGGLHPASLYIAV